MKHDDYWEALTLVEKKIPSREIFPSVQGLFRGDIPLFRFLRRGRSHLHSIISATSVTLCPVIRIISRVRYRCTDYRIRFRSVHGFQDIGSLLSFSSIDYTTISDVTISLAILELMIDIDSRPAIPREPRFFV